MIYKQSLALHPGGTFPSLQIAQVTDKLYGSDAKPLVSGVALVKKQRKEGLWLLRSPAHCWERSEGFWSMCVLLSKLDWKKDSSPKNAFELLFPGVFLSAQDPQAKISAAVRKQNACKENQSRSVYVVLTSPSFFLLIITVCQSDQSPTTGLDPVLNMRKLTLWYKRNHLDN